MSSSHLCVLFPLAGTHSRTETPPTPDLTTDNEESDFQIF